MARARGKGSGARARGKSKGKEQGASGKGQEHGTRSMGQGVWVYNHLQSDTIYSPTPGVCHERLGRSLIYAFDS